jgi:putative methyltransferase (TIGR04325 family)
MALRDTLRDITPPILARTMRKALGGRGLRFEGDYGSWAEASAASGGYDKEEIARRVYDAELKVAKGEAVDARDGVLFDTMQFSLPVMAALMRAAARSGGSLRVVDFGGAFGGLYRHYKALGVPGEVAWTVVEQRRFASLGAAQFQNGELRFLDSLEAALAASQPDVLLLSSVLQYLPDPYALIRRIGEASAAHVVIDRTPCSELDRDVLTVQTVPPSIYPASYPCWILARRRLVSSFTPAYQLWAEFTDGTGQWSATAAKFQLAGFVFDRQPVS